MSTIRIQVTKDDIAEAEQGNPESCMVWRAVTRTLQLETQTGATPVQVSVDGDTVAFEPHWDSKKGREVEVELPKTVRDKIRKWDELEDQTALKPFEFDLNLPDDWREQVSGITR